MSSQESTPTIFRLKPGLHDLKFADVTDAALGRALDGVDAGEVRIRGAEPTLEIPGMPQLWKIHVDGGYLAVEALARQLQRALGKPAQIEDMTLHGKIEGALLNMVRAR